MSGARNIFLWTFLYSLIFVVLINDANGKPHDGEPHSHHKMRVSRSFSSDDDFFSSHRNPSDSSFGNAFPQGSNGNFPSSFGSGPNSNFGSSNFGSSNFETHDFGSNGFGSSSFGSSFDNKESDHTFPPHSSDRLEPTGDGGFKTKTKLFGEDAEITFHAAPAQNSNPSLSSVNIPLTPTNKSSGQFNTGGWDAKAAARQEAGTVTYYPNYVYRPPSGIDYKNFGGSIIYPTYVGPLPSFVYNYISSKNKYRELLAGMCLYNLAKVFTDRDVYNFHHNYVQKDDEMCRFGVQHGFNTPQEMAIDCKAMTYFIYDNNHGMPDAGSLLSKTTQDNLRQAASLIPNTRDVMASAGHVFGSDLSSPQTTPAPAVMSIYDSKLTGHPVEIETGMECYVARSVLLSNMKRKIPCKLLQSYTTQSLFKGNSGAMITSSVTVLIISMAAILMN